MIYTYIHTFIYIYIYIQGCIYIYPGLLTILLKNIADIDIDFDPK